MRNEMKKFRLAKKLATAVEMKKLQQQVTLLNTQQQQRTDKVLELQA